MTVAIASTYQYFSDPSGRVDRITPPGIAFCPQKSFCPQHEGHYARCIRKFLLSQSKPAWRYCTVGSIEVSWRGWTSRAKAGSMPTVTIIKGSGTSGVSGGHSGEWRGSAMSQWCSLSSSREGAITMYRATEQGFFCLLPARSHLSPRSFTTPLVSLKYCTLPATCGRHALHSWQ